MKSLRPIHYTVNDGLVAGEVQLALRDREGGLWFGTQHGLSLLKPEQDSGGHPPAVAIQSLRVAGTIEPISLLGVADIEGLFIGETLKATAGNREEAAEMLGIGERTLYRKIKEYGL